ncbi:MULTISPECIES: hypothetical protein [unclassified Pseudomonas]|uniref:hypothetical protein n=1 Tax=unclassified Pseudomonas TaxID=196821 RepID=UPI00244A40EB|nr:MULTISPECIES: hypothetical protein [unclassified Pseudomonas]MDG9926548.1 hypothetical protein [Pseudomonas sp. GD04042]MDH0481368.1 hypothetical protein [Pseudomonas sp. GD04015]MDH0603317.1 hypothetical protein [Pseudomonas sp. GD03869]
MDARRAAELAEKSELSFDDWLEITGVNIGKIGKLGMYSVKSDGIRFHPNKNKGKSGWSKKQVKDAIRLAPSEGYEAEQQLKQENASQLKIPCSPRELVEFALERDVSGDLRGLLPGPFIAAVYRAEDQRERRSNAQEEAKPSHLLLIAALLELLKAPRQTGQNQEGIKSQLLERFNWPGLKKRTLEKIFAAANKAAEEARKTAE